MNATQPHIGDSGEQHCKCRAGGVPFDPKNKNTTQLHLGRLLQTFGRILSKVLRPGCLTTGCASELCFEAYSRSVKTKVEAFLEGMLLGYAFTGYASRLYINWTR